MNVAAPTLDLDRPAGHPAPLIDPFARAITYLRVSVTDRCDFRCVYCMSENMTFLPKARPADAGGTRPAVLGLRRQGRAQAAADRRRAAGAARHHDAVLARCRAISQTGALDELTLTTNGSQLAKYARRTEELRRRAHQRLARHARPRQVPRDHPLGRSRPRCSTGIDAAQAAGLKVKINAVALKGVNEDELADLVAWAHGRGMDLTIIEVMPLGDIGDDRLDQYLPLSIVRARLAERFTLEDIDYQTGGPARYVRVEGDRRPARLHHADDA